MSITIVGIIPYLLVRALCGSNAKSLVHTPEMESDIFKQYISSGGASAMDNSCNQYQTVYVDKNLLVKTLEEHGLKEIKEERGVISGKAGKYVFKFYRQNETDAFIMFISKGLSEQEVYETLDNLDSEYAQNAQEAAYLQIKERLEKDNLQISEEEVLEDNTIILTVNLD